MKSVNGISAEMRLLWFSLSSFVIASQFVIAKGDDECSNCSSVEDSPSVLLLQSQATIMHSDMEDSKDERILLTPRRKSDGCAYCIDGNCWVKLTKYKGGAYSVVFYDSADPSATSSGNYDDEEECLDFAAKKTSVSGGFNTTHTTFAYTEQSVCDFFKSLAWSVVEAGGYGCKMEKNCVQDDAFVIVDPTTVSDECTTTTTTATTTTTCAHDDTDNGGCGYDGDSDDGDDCGSNCGETNCCGTCVTGGNRRRRAGYKCDRRRRRRQ